MTLFRKVVALLFLCPLLTIHYAHAQTGQASSNAGSGGNYYTPYGEPQLGNAAIYVFGVGTTPNGQPTNLIDCTLVGIVSNVMGTCNNDGSSAAYVKADSYGNFDLTGTYYQDCTSDSQPVYFEAVGGTVNSIGNGQLALLSIPPSEYTCGYIYSNSTSIYISITDFTNVMAAFALGPFANYSNSPYDGISTFTAKTADAADLATAFDAANNVISITNGYYTGSNTTVNYQLNTIADVIAPCIQSDGSLASGQPCPTLYSATQGPLIASYYPANTWQAMESIGQNPTNNVTAQYDLISTASTVPWSPYYSSSSIPNTWTITPSSNQPTISSLSAYSAIYHNTSNHYIYIYGTNLVDETTSPYTYPVVVINGDDAAVDTANSSPTSLHVLIPPSYSYPSHPAYGALGVYLEGNFSNFIPFTIYWGPSPG
jgi:hypothetical protein